MKRVVVARLTVVALLICCGALGATDVAAADGCGNQAFRTGPSAGLPDCRAYEKVSPADKGGVDAQSSPSGPTTGGFMAAADGNGVIYTTLNGVFAGSKSAPATISYRAVRTPSGWVTRGIDPGIEVAYPVGQVEHPFFTADLSAQIFYTRVGLTGASPTGGFYRVGFEPETTEQVGPGPKGPSNATRESFAASRDARTIAFQESPFEGEGKIYLSREGALEVASLLPSGAPATGFNVKIGGKGVQNDLSTDGARLYFSAEDSSPLQVYLREAGQTLLVSQPNEGVSDPEGPRASTFYAASGDGSKAFFTSHAKLTADATTGPRDEGNDLYEFDVARPAGSKLRDLTVSGAETAGARVEAVLGVSEDGSYVYFTARGTIAGQGTPGAVNLFVRHGGATSLVATVETEPDFFYPFEQTPGFPIQEKFWINPDGKTLVFQSPLPQLGYDNAGHIEVYTYDAPSGRLACASCNPSGAPATADSTIAQNTYYLFTGPAHQRNANEAGTEAFFTSGEALVAADTNGQPDVYEYEGGSPKLISSGTGNEPSILLGASGDGNDVFFGTRQRLTASDNDDAIDVYDARANGGLVEASPEGAAACAGEACRPAPVPPPGAGDPGSSQVSGPGNLPALPRHKPKKAKRPKKHHKKHHAKNHRKHRQAANGGAK